MRVSNDNGETFGPVLTLAANGTIGASEQDKGKRNIDKKITVFGLLPVIEYLLNLLFILRGLFS